MKKHLKKRMLFLIALLVFPIPYGVASASQATSYTYTFDDKGYFSRTQDAYLPDKTITDLNLTFPEDIFIDNANMMYIADSGNHRLVKYSIDTGTVSGILQYEGMNNPRGVFVTKKRDIYVADPSARKVFRFDEGFNFIESFERPASPTFADTAYEPLRIAVDNGGNLYIIGEGVYNGVIQLAPSGDFLGYFSVNKTKLSLVQAIQNAIFTRAQLANLVSRDPTTFSNIFIDEGNLVYTTTMGTHVDGLKKHDTAGGNILKNQDWTSGEMTDLWVDPQGIMYTSDNNGYINIYSTAGELIFNFGSYVADLDVSGLFSRLPSIAVDNNGNIWTVDGDKGYLQSFKPTEYARMVYNAMGLYEQGLYDKALEKWSEVLRLNQMSILAHDGIGKAYLHAERYEDAMEHFSVSGNREFYSDAFWEIRNQWIQSSLPVVIPVLAALWLVFFLIKKLDKKKRVKNARRALAKKLLTIPILGDVLYAFKIPRHPIDRYYDIRVHKNGSVPGASILFFIIFMFNRTGKGFIYQLQAVEDMDINSIVLGFFAILTLFIVCNFLVTSIKDGDGSFKQVYMIPAYGSIPYMTALFTTTILSHFLTYNETFLLTLITQVCLVWSVLCIFIGFMTVHDYTLKETVISLIITVVFMIIAALVILIVLVMFDQLWSFLKSLGKEMTRNVNS